MHEEKSNLKQKNALAHTLFHSRVHLRLELCGGRLGAEALPVDDGLGGDWLRDARAALAQPAARPPHHLQQAVTHAVRPHSLLRRKRIALLWMEGRPRSNYT